MSSPSSPLTEKLCFLIVAFGAAVIPVYVSLTGYELFRLPKLLLLHACGILLIGLALAAWIVGKPIVARPWPRDVVFLIAAIAIWSVITTIASTHRLHSAESLMTVVASIAFFAASYSVARTRSVAILLIAFVPAVVNGLLALLQRFGIWNPFDYFSAGASRHLTIGLLGNPNDLGSYLVFPALAAAALAVVDRSHRALALAVAAIAAAGILASETVGAIIALAVGLVILGFGVSRRAAIAVAVAGIVAVIAFFAAADARRATVRSDIAAARRGDLGPLLSRRWPAILASLEMFRMRPATGLGPGTFGYQYFDAKTAVDERHYELLNKYPENFGEAHNEYLHFLAEGGVISLVLFLAAMGVVAARARVRRESSTLRQQFARVYAAPLVAGVALTSIAQFPLRLAAPVVTMVFLAAATCAWAEDDAVA